MKKISLIITFFLFCLLNISLIKANEEDVTKPIMLLKGYEYNDVLNYDNYTIVKTNVDYQNTGEYEIEYIHNETKETFVKKVYIVENNYAYTKLRTKKLNEETKIIKQLDDGSMIYATRIHYNYNEDNIVDYYVYKEKDNQIIWKSLLFIDVIGKIVDIYDDGEFTFVLSNIYSEKTSDDIYLHVLNKYGEVILTKTYQGSSSDNITGMYIDSNNIYIYGNTLSNDLDFKHQSYSEDSYVLKINKDNLLIEQKYIFNEKYLDNILDCVSYKDNLYVLQQYVRTDIMRVTYRILKINPLGEILNSYIFYHDIYFKPIKIGIFNNDLYILANNLNIAELYKLNIDSFKNETVETIESYKGIDFYIDYLTLTVIYQNEEESLIKIYNSEIKNIFQKTVDMKAKKLINKNTLLDVNNNIIIVDYVTIDIINNQFSVKYNNKKMYNQSDIYIDENLYGTYLNLYYYPTPIIDFFGYLDTNIPLITSVQNNQIYDNNLNINFNGIGYLNNKPINSNYLITTPGEYELKIIGYNSENTINFEVLNISTQKEKYNENIKIKDDKINNIIDSQIEKEYMFEENEKQNNDKYYWCLILPLISISILIFVLIQKRG